MSLKRALLLGLVAFALALIVVLPARWVGSALPAEVQCSQWGGSVWRGQCRNLAVNQGTKVAMRLTVLHWQLKPLALLRLALAADFQSEWPGGQAQGYIELKPGGTIRLRETTVQSEVDRRLIGALPNGWSGRADIRKLEFDWQKARIERLGGEIRVTDLVDARGSRMGGYHMLFPSSATPPFTGTLKDAGDGPLEVQAQLQLTADRSWNLGGRMRARDTGNARLARQLDMFASADASGWRQLSAAGTFN